MVPMWQSGDLAEAVKERRGERGKGGGRRNYLVCVYERVSCAKTTYTEVLIYFISLLIFCLMLQQSKLDTSLTQVSFDLRHLKYEM